MRLFLLLRLGTLDLRRAAQRLLLVLALLALLPAGALGLGGEADADQAVLGLELLEGLGGVVDEGEAGGLAATELGAQAEDLDLLLLGLVQGADLLAELLLGDVGTAGVEDVTAEMPISQRVLWAMIGSGDEFFDGGRASRRVVSSRRSGSRRLLTLSFSSSKRRRCPLPY
jgi:hypothetical protein